MLRSAAVIALLAAALSAGVAPPATAQQRFEDLAGHGSFREVERARGQLGGGGRVEDVRWLADGSGVEYGRRGERFVVPFATGVAVPAEGDAEGGPGVGERGAVEGPRPARGRQADRVRSPDGAWDAVSRDDNVAIERPDGGEARQVTTDGRRDFGYGRASWVYGEELDQQSAMWWSPDSAHLAFYEFDDRLVPDFPLPVDWTGLRPSTAHERYPKPGDPNPVANLLVHRMEDGSTVRVDVGPDPDQYVYGVEWAPDGSALLFLRTNRRQDTLELVAADPRSGQSRVVLTERQATFQNNRPILRLLEDGRRFIWESEASGWAQLELRDLDGGPPVPLTAGAFPVLAIVAVDERAGWLYYTAASGAVPLDAQLHRVRLDGSGPHGLASRLTPSDLHHSRFSIAPDHSRFTCTSEAIHVPPSTALYGMDGTTLATLAEWDLSRLHELGLPMPELFQFVAADGKTPLWGALYKPRHFDSSRKYPLVVDVYGGPGVRALNDRWEGARPECELGFLVAKLENRGTTQRGKAFEDATYLRLGGSDLDDQAAGVRALAARPYVDATRVGITGASYGGTLAALGVLRHPEVFHAAVAISGVTDWRNYDTIYTERYMRRPAENEEGYDAGSCVKLAEKLEGPLPGKLLIMQGMVDDNVHPTNAWQLVDALQRRNVPFEMSIFPRADHGVGGPAARGARWGFLQRALGAATTAAPDPEPGAVPGASPGPTAVPSTGSRD